MVQQPAAAPHRQQLHNVYRTVQTMLKAIHPAGAWPADIGSRLQQPRKQQIQPRSIPVWWLPLLQPEPVQPAPELELRVCKDSHESAKND